jgi:hypothetical protein
MVVRRTGDSAIVHLLAREGMLPDGRKGGVHKNADFAPRPNPRRYRCCDFLSRFKRRKNRVEERFAHRL